MTIKRTCLTLAAALAFLGGCQSVEGESESPARPEPARQVSAAEAALAGLRGARLNVLINLNGIDDKQFCKEMKISADDLMKEGEELHEKISDEVEKVMSKDG